MATEYMLSYTASEIDRKLGKIDEHTHTWNDLNDKPFYEDVVIDYHWHEGYEPLEIVEYNGFPYYKISETPLTKEEIIGATIVAINEQSGTPVYETIEIVEEMILENPPGMEGLIVLGGTVMSVFEQSDSGEIVYGKGVWVGFVEGFIRVLRFHKATVKRLEPRFINPFTKLYEYNDNVYYDEAHSVGVTKNELIELYTNGLILLYHSPMTMDDYRWGLVVEMTAYPEDDYASVSVITGGYSFDYCSIEYTPK